MAEERKTQPGLETTAQVIVHLQAAMDEFKKSPHRSDWSSISSFIMAQQSVDSLNFLINGLVDSLPLQAYEIDNERPLGINESIPTSGDKAAPSQVGAIHQTLASMVEALIAEMERADVEVIVVMDNNLTEQREEGQGGIDEPHAGYEYD
jgi:hypothetical protein